LCPSRPGAIAGNLLNFLCLLSASALWATNAGRLQNGTVSTGKLNYFSVCCGKASNWTVANLAQKWLVAAKPSSLVIPKPL
jgi:hypothetical protein